LRSARYQELLSKLRAFRVTGAALGAPGLLRFRGERVETDLTSSFIQSRNQLLPEHIENTDFFCAEKPDLRLLRLLGKLHQLGYRAARPHRNYKSARGGVYLKTHMQVRWLTLKGVCSTHEMEFRKPYADEKTLDTVEFYRRLTYVQAQDQDMKDVMKKRHSQLISDSVANRKLNLR